MKSATQEIDDLLERQCSWELQAAIKLNIIAKHIDNIESLLVELVKKNEQ